MRHSRPLAAASGVRMGRYSWAPRTIHEFNFGANVSQSQTVDLKQVGSLTRPIRKITLRATGSVTAAGGGGVATLTGEAPLQFAINNVRINMPYRGVTFPRACDAQGRDLYLAQIFRQGNRTTLTAPTPGAGATGTFEATCALGLTVPGPVEELCYWHPQRMGSMSMELAVGALTDYASTNVASTSGLRIRVEVEEMSGPLSDVPGPDEPHFVRVFGSQRLPHESQARDLPSTGLSTGLMDWLLLRVRDASVVGDADRVDGLVRRFTLTQGARNLFELMGVRALAVKNQDENPMGAAIMSGLVFWKPSRDNLFHELVNLGLDPATLHADTQDAVEDGVTAVAPAAGDHTQITTGSLVPTPECVAEFARNGIRLV